MDDELDESAYHASSVGRAGSEDSEPFVRLEKGSAAERGVISLLKDYMSSAGSKHQNAYMIDELLEEIAAEGR